MSQSEKRTRQRGKNFSPSEELMLLQLLKPYKHIIDNRRSDAFTCQMKKDAWEHLAQEFTIQTGMPRTWRTLKDKYKNMNTKLKTEGKRMDESQDECETTASSCVSVVYEDGDEEDSVVDITQENEGNDNDTEVIEEDLDLEEVQMKSPVATNSKHLSSPIQDRLPTNYLQRSLEAEKRVLVRLQQRFYHNENARASKRHRLELKSINLKNQLLELELEERRKRIKGTKGDKENTIVLS